MFLIGLPYSAGAFLLLVRLAGLRGPGFWLLLLLFAINGPLHNSLKEGNTTHIVLLLLAMIGIIGLGIDLMLAWLGRRLFPWAARSE